MHSSKSQRGSGRRTTLLAAILLAACLPAAYADPQWWPKDPMPVGNTLRAIWGSGPNDVYAIGDFGTVLHYPGRWFGDINGDGYVNVGDLQQLVAG